MLVEREAIILVGGGGHCRSVADVIAAGGEFFAAGIVERRGAEAIVPACVEVIGTDEDLAALAERYENFAITIGKVGRSGRRRELFEYLAELGVRLPTIVSPSGRAASSAALGAGTVLMHNAMVNAGARIGCNCIINTAALVEHDAEVGDHCHVATGAIVNGGCVIGDDVFLGSGAVVSHGVRIADGAIIGAGCVVVDSIDESGVYVGVPARRMATVG